ncbi:hydroxyacid dehydrogenase [hot springs metagenome]|uniref:Hydroxyacid dehydrogenase n=1 Tax=hot springs metagenome TaxID=433727 RepID=A0A5J4KW15_9ZZZZ
MKKVLYFEILNYKKENLELLKKNFELVILNNPSQITPDILKDISVIFAPLGYYFGEDIFSMSPDLKVIATNTTGVPHIDVERAAARGIHIISLRDEKEFLNTITPTAELTMGLIINITRNVISAIKSVLDGKWSRWEFGGQAMLSRMSIGIVGLGRLGKMVAKYATAFGMDISYYDPFITHDLQWIYKRCESIEELVSNVDIVSVHIPMNKENRHFFNRGVFSKFKKGSYFINTARGEVVDSEALIDALEKGIIKGAALDVLDGEFEPDFSERVLSHSLVRYAQTHDNLIITPHIAGSTEDAWYLTQRYVIEQTIEYVRRFQ